MAPVVVADAAYKQALAILKLGDEFGKCSDGIEAAYAKLRAAAKQYAGLIKDSDFNLDANDPKNKKIVTDVKKSVLDALKGIEDLVDKMDDMFDKIQTGFTESRKKFLNLL